MLLLAALFVSALASAAEQPNIVFILADDLGSPQGNTVPVVIRKPIAEVANARQNLMKQLFVTATLSLLVVCAVYRADSKTTSWNGYDQLQFTFEDRQALLVQPKGPPTESRGSGAPNPPPLLMTFEIGASRAVFEGTRGAASLPRAYARN
jgi:hypothetical protein